MKLKSFFIIIIAVLFSFNLFSQTNECGTMLPANTSAFLINFRTVDANGDAYHPDTHNYMSYSRKACRNHFSDEQLSSIYVWSGYSSRLPFIKTTTLKDETITTNTTINNDVVIIDNVTIDDNAKLVIDHCYETIIKKDFEVKLGSQLEIK
ncbi:MAG: hypothetical protein LBN93_08285 [Candidatus Symbiothrix sp.]|jgi:hypothetical protein|nr:hypothetical protein [Candidatus Symbiothrix sp.]